MATKQDTADDRQNAQRQENTQIARKSPGWMFRNEPGILGSRGSFFTNPYQLMRRMTEEMDRTFGFGGSGEVGPWSPATEVVERDGKYIVRSELAGLKPEEVKVEVTDGELIIQGERKSEHEETQGRYRRSEHRYGQFYRSIALPEGVDPAQVHARFENGMLEVTIPAPPQQQSQRRQIPIEGTSGGRNPNPSPEPHG